MADIISQQISENIKTALGTLSTYGGTPTVERERSVLRISGRYPFIELSGPQIEVISRARGVDMCDLHYVARYFVDTNDDNTTSDGEITYLTRNVSGDIIKKLMEDTDRGDLAEYTFIDECGYGFDVDEAANVVIYYVAVAFHVHARIDSTNPYNQG